MKKSNPKPYKGRELHILLSNKELLNRIKIDAVKEGLRTGAMVEKILIDWYTK